MTTLPAAVGRERHTRRARLAIGDDPGLRKGLDVSVLAARAASSRAAHAFRSLCLLPTKTGRQLPLIAECPPSAGAHR